MISHDKEIKDLDGIRLADWLTLTQGDHSGLSTCKHRSLKVDEEAEEALGEIGLIQFSVAGFENGGREP